MPTVTIINPTIIIESDRKLRTAAYCRVSSSSEDQLNSYQAQLTYYSNKFNDSETEELVELYADEGISGTRDDKRPEFMRMINDCRRGKIDRIYAKSISRFARNTRDCLKYIRELRSLGITIMFEKENIDTARITDEILITIMGGLAQEESVSTSNNLKWSIRSRMKNGTYRNSQSPFGFDVQDDHYEINEPQAEVVRKIFTWYINGSGLQTIAEMLNAENVEISQYGEKWCPMTIRYILTNERYIGDAVYQKYYRTDTVPFIKKKNNGELPQYYANDVNPQIIDEETFRIVQSIIAERGHNYINNNNIFSRKIICSECGATYKCRNGSDGNRWVCRTHDKRSASCDSSIWSEKDIKELFIKLYNKLQINYREILSPALKQLTELNMKRYKGNQYIMVLNKELIQLKEQLHIISNLRTKGYLSEAKYQEQTAELKRKISKAQKEIRLLTQYDNDDTTQQIELLVDMFESRDQQMIYFNTEVFEYIVDKIIVLNSNELEFHLIGGLRFKERIR